MKGLIPRIHAPFSVSPAFFLILLITWCLSTLPRIVNATSLTYSIAAHEKACFYAHVDKVGEKIAFYFAVCSKRTNRAACKLCGREVGTRIEPLK